MPLVLPAPVVTPLPLSDAQALDRARVTDFRFEVLSNNESIITNLDGVRGGDVTWDFRASIKGSGTIDVTDTGQRIADAQVDWLNIRIKPYAILGAANDGEDPLEYPLGVFLPAAPVEAWNDGTRTWAVELLDKNVILDQDIVVNATTGQPITYSVAKASNILDKVKELIIDAGESAVAVGESSATTGADMTWDVGTSRLKIINDLLDAGNFRSLWVDYEGQYQVTEYIPPAQRTPIYQFISPFKDDETSLMAPAWTRDRDIFSIPNRYVAIGQGDSETEALVAFAVNDNENSPYSYQSRGNRWITQVDTGVEAEDQAALDGYAQRRLNAATSVSSGMTVQHLLLPNIQVNRAIEFVNTTAGHDFLCYITKTTFVFDPLALCVTEIQEAFS